MIPLFIDPKLARAGFIEFSRLELIVGVPQKTLLGESRCD